MSVNPDLNPDPTAPKPDRADVLEQLERLFAHAAFKNSQRSQALLRYVVERCGAVSNEDGHLKERALGIDVFGRDPSYDTNADPIVRVVAGDVRKRIAQYYHEPGHEGEIRIDLPLGRYCPEFHFPAADLSDVPVAATIAVATAPSKDETSLAAADVRRSWWAYTLPVSMLGLLAVAVFWQMRHRAPAPVIRAEADSALEMFWRPILQGAATVQVGVGPWPGITNLPADESRKLFPGFDQGMKRPVGWWDFQVAAQIIAFLQRSGSDFQIQDESVANLSTLSQGPIVLIGATTNPWVLKLTDRLRFHFVRGSGHYWIEDRDHLGKQYRTSPGLIPGSQVQYAIVARMFDPTTGHDVVILAGVGSPATVFAGRVTTVPADMEKLVQRLPPEWKSKNVEALVAGDAINGEPGAPRVVAATVW